MQPARDLLAAATRIQPDTVALRRRLHRRPEIGLTLPQTQQTVLDALAGLPLRVSRGRGVTSVTGVLEGEPARADGAAPRRHGRAADAGGPGLDFASEVARRDARLRARHPRGHAGRRGPAASAADAASCPARWSSCSSRGRRARGGAGVDAGGGRAGRQAGFAESYSAYALHITTHYESGVVAVTPRARTMAAAGHPAHHRDPAAAGTPRTRPGARPDPGGLRDRAGHPDDGHPARSASSTRPSSPIAKIVAGTTDNVIPETAEMAGTMRTCSGGHGGSRTALHRLVPAGSPPRTAPRVELDISAGLPGDGQRRRRRRPGCRHLTVGCSARTGPAGAGPGDGRRGLVVRAASGAGGDGLPRRPAARIEPGEAPANHSNKVVFDEDAMAVGVATHVAVALAALAG